MIEINKDLINVVIIGAGKGGTSIINVLLLLDNVHIIGIADKNPHAVGLDLARKNGIKTVSDYINLVQDERVDVIIEATGQPWVQEHVRRIKNKHATIMDAQAAHLMMTVVAKQEELLHVEELKEQLATILNTAQEGIQLVDKEGYIRYVNKSFSDITKVQAEERIGKNIFAVSPQGALAEVLQTGQPVFGNLNVVEGTNIEVISNASPINVGGEISGAVVVFRDVTDIRMMACKLEKSREVIKFLKEEINELASAKYTFKNLLSTNPGFLSCVKTARQAANGSSTILLTGESGTGKELFAHAIHNYSDRARGPFIRVNCAAIPDNLLESELFGYEKGAFTGAVKAKMGKFELAQGGTVFLDEIGDMSVNLQAKLLRVLQEKEIERLGSNFTKKIDVRIIAATNHNLDQHVKQGNFRQDLYYRLNVISIEIPPLRERSEDIPLLVRHFLSIINRRHRKSCTIEPEAMKLLNSYAWPGNVREMENLVERAVIMTEGNSIQLELLKSFINPVQVKAAEEILSLAELEKQMIYKALKKYGHSMEGKKLAAQALKISLATLYNKLKEYEK